MMRINFTKTPAIFRILCVTCICLTALLAAKSINADSIINSASNFSAPAQKIVKKCKSDGFTIAGIREFNGNYENKIHYFSFDDLLIIKFNENIDTLANWPKDQKLILWFNDIPYHNLTVWSINTNTREMVFKLTYDSSTKASWDVLYLLSYRKIFKYYDVMNVQVGTDNKCLTLPGGNNAKIYFKCTERWMLWASYIILLALIGLFIWLIRWDHLIRNTISFAEGVTVVKKFSTDPAVRANEVRSKDIPFSLSRSQLCFWLFIISISFVFIWLNTDGDMPNITGSTAMLLGISGGTSVLSKIIESSGKSTSDPKPTAADFYKNSKSKNFFLDIVSDDNGLSVSRLQMVIFTFILGLYYAWYVMLNLEMPEFTSTTLLLMGISSSTYAGIKFNE
jgi:hypothetical protein